METNATRVQSSWVRPRTDIDDIFPEKEIEIVEKKQEPVQDINVINQEIMSTSNIQQAVDTIVDNKANNIIKESLATIKDFYKPDVENIQEPRKRAQSRGSNNSSKKVLTAKEMMARMQEKIAVLDMIDKSLNVDVIVTDSTVDKSVRDILTAYQKELLEVQAKYTEQVSNL